MDILTELDAINRQLAKGGTRLRIELRGKTLNIRGPLPDRLAPELLRRQRLSLKLNSDIDGLREAEQTLRLIQRQLQRGSFNWVDWQSSNLKNTSQRNVVEAISNFKKAFFADPSRRRSPSGSRTTWSSAYLPYFRRLSKLAGEQSIERKLFQETLNSYEENSRSRQQCATALAALAKQLNIELPKDWRSSAGGYGLHRARFRNLPTDEEIIKASIQIPNRAWRLAYGLMATYGLRNHELFFCDLSSLVPEGDGIIRVLSTTKTGEHQVWPFQPDWVKRFGLENLGRMLDPLPSIQTDLRRTTLQQVGRRVSEQFRRYGLPLTPYDLRHAWAVRTIHIGLPDTVAARMMGHSVAIHTRTYHHWITRRDQQRAVDSALSHNSNPKN